MRKRIALIAVILALTITPVLLAVPGRDHGNRASLGIIGMFGHLKEELGLSDQQVDEIKAILADVHEQNAEAREQLRGARKNVTGALLDNPSDVASAQRILDEQNAAKATLERNVLNATAKAIAVLTPEQREKLRTIIAERAERRANRRR